MVTIRLRTAACLLAFLLYIAVCAQDSSPPSQKSTIVPVPDYIMEMLPDVARNMVVIDARGMGKWETSHWLTFDLVDVNGKTHKFLFHYEVISTADTKLCSESTVEIGAGFPPATAVLEKN